eukprot:1157955-Pelagomonas_calceolata.AAC.1
MRQERAVCASASGEAWKGGRKGGTQKERAAFEMALGVAAQEVRQSNEKRREREGRAVPKGSRWGTALERATGEAEPKRGDTAKMSCL